MLQKAVAALKTDKAKALDLINKGEGADSWTAIFIAEVIILGRKRGLGGLVLAT
jgi:hypothetical protein